MAAWRLGTRVEGGKMVISNLEKWRMAAVVTAAMQERESRTVER